MASFTTTTSAVFIPEVWAKECQVARESKLLMANLIERHDGDVSQKGDVIHIPLISNLSASDIGNDGSLTDAAVTESEKTLTVNKWKGVAINVPDILKAQSQYDLMQKYSAKIGYALGLIVEQDLLGLYSGLSQTVGASGTVISDANLLTAIQYLDDARAPMEDRSWVIKPAAKRELLLIDKFVRADSIAFSKDSSPIVKANFGQIYGVNVYVSPEVIAATGNHNMLFHKSAFGLAMQKDMKMEKFARTQFSDRLGGSELYGFGELRDDHAVDFKN